MPAYTPSVLLWGRRYNAEPCRAVAAAMLGDPVFEICGSSRAAPIVKENVPGSVACRYRSIKFVSAAALVEEFSDQWYVEFKKNRSGTHEEIVLTITGGSHVPEQPAVETRGISSSRGTLVVTEAKTDILTGPFVLKFLQSSNNAHDIFVTTKGFEFHRLIPELVNLKTRNPKLFLRRKRSRAEAMKKSSTPK